MASGEKFCLRWNNFENNISNTFKELREDGDFFDVTLACDDDQVQVHKLVLSACSPFFRTVLKRNPHQHPLLYLKGVKIEEITSVINFMYYGEVNVAQEDLNSFLAIAEDLKVKGLTQKDDENQKQTENTPDINRISAPKTFAESPLVTKKISNQQYSMKPTTPKPTSLQRNEIPNIISKEVQNFRPEIKTESMVVLDCEDNDQADIMINDDYQATEYSYDDDSYHQQNMMYPLDEVGVGMSTAESEENQQFEDYVNQNCSKVPEEQGGNGLLCHICNKITAHIGNMKQHFEVHHCNRSYKCQVCMKEFRTKNSLDTHKRRHGHYM